MKKALIVVALASVMAGCVQNGVITTSSIGAAETAYHAATFSDDDAKRMADQAAAYHDSHNKLSSPNSKYSKRLARIVKGLTSEDGLALNFRVYETKEVNAFAMANGTVRVYSGLLDRMSDDEVRSVIGHEIGHVKLGHSKKATQMAMADSAARQGASATGGTAALLNQSELADFSEELLNAQFSQKQESEADGYSVSFMKRHKWNAKANITAMQKLMALESGSHSMLDSHPATSDRIKHIQSLL